MAEVVAATCRSHLVSGVALSLSAIVYVMSLDVAGLEASLPSFEGILYNLYICHGNLSELLHRVSVILKGRPLLTLQLLQMGSSILGCSSKSGLQCPKILSTSMPTL